MKRVTLIFTWILITGSLLTARADEGLWIPLLIEQLNIQNMQENGFKLTADNIYSINNSSMKDAVMIFGGGCTAELISDEGLIITNHHCGYRRIQQHSTMDHDYLTNGFWAMSGEEELPNPGLTVTFLKWMEDVTDTVMSGVTNAMNEQRRDEMIQSNIAGIIQNTLDSTHYKVHVEPFFAGNQYFLLVEEVFRDVRLVGAPPSAIGKFGGDTDNWMWPRHTGDFSLFRIYADSNNLPTDFSPDNVPYKPAEYFPVSLKGVQPDDFTIVFGYPGRTYEYVPSYHIKMLTEDIYPRLIAIRDQKLEIMNRDMDKDPKVRIQYSAKSASISNSWKRWIGEIKGLNKLHALEKKEKFENDFQNWVDSDPETKAKYHNLLSDYEKLYARYAQYRLANDYIREVFYRKEVFYRNGTELVSFSGRFHKLVQMVEKGDSDEKINEIVEDLKKTTINFYKNYNLPTDKKIFVAMLRMLDENMGTEFQPSFYINLYSNYHDNYEKYASRIYKKTLFVHQDQVLEILSSPKKSDINKIKNDPVYLLFESVDDLYSSKIFPEYNRLAGDLNKFNRLYMAAHMEFQEDKIFYPDANSTLRLSYGKVKGYKPRDAVYYKFYTTIEGIIEKDNPEIYDYNVPDKLKELFAKNDYGRYAENGELHVCFIATNHTTGGNSGSPVINAEGHLVGVNFDRAWEGVMSDLMFNPDQCRNISLDIRYALFIIDKFAGAGYLLEEMELVE